jgi:hypothetical protein
MYITYHKDVVSPGIPVPYIPHNVLDKDIKEFILEKDVEQKSYEIRSNETHCFIYLNNGDRIDVQL